MLTSKEQEILDNAPEGATHYSETTDSCWDAYYKDEMSMVYCWINNAQWEANEDKDCVDLIDLADLRKKQGKTTVTSNDICWSDGAVCAVVSDREPVQYDYLPAIGKMTCGGEGYMFGADKFNSSYYTLVHRLDEYKEEDANKKQGKTVWDAVNEYEAYLNPHDESEFTFIVVNHADKIVMCHDKNHGKQYVCTIKEFNQYVKDMSEAEWLNPGFPFDYELHTKNFKENKMSEEKPRMKVEYVKVCEDKFLFWQLAQIQYENNDVYYLDDNTYILIDSNSWLLSQYNESNLYRKVETEIKTEKRWLIYDMSGYLVSSVSYAPKPEEGRQIIPIEITVEV